MKLRHAANAALLLATSILPAMAWAQEETTEAEQAQSVIPPAPSASTTEPLACRPDCRAGFVCIDGQCVSACNPPCEAGTRCTAEATCEAEPGAGATVFPAPAIATESPRKPDPAATSDAELKAELRAHKLEQKARTRRWQQAHRFDHHLTASVAGRSAIVDLRGNDVSADAVISGYGILSVGYMHNFAQYFGLSARLNLGLGVVGLTSVREVRNGADYTDTDATFTSLVELEVTPYAGSFGPFYVGPMAFVGYRGYADHRLETRQLGTTLRSVPRRNRAVAGAGVDMGVLLGRRRDLQLSWSLRSSFNGTLPFEAQLGFGYRFGHLWSDAAP